jgi:hypothetical protein
MTLLSLTVCQLCLLSQFDCFSHSSHLVQAMFTSHLEYGSGLPAGPVLLPLPLQSVLLATRVGF